MSFEVLGLVYMKAIPSDSRRLQEVRRRIEQLVLVLKTSEAEVEVETEAWLAWPIEGRSNVEAVCGICYREGGREIARLVEGWKVEQAVPSDPNYIKLAVACGRIEQWYQHNYPSFVQVVDSGTGPKAAYDETDARSRILLLEQEQDKAMAAKRRVDRITQKAQNGANGE